MCQSLARSLERFRRALLCASILLAAPMAWAGELTLGPDPQGGGGGTNPTQGGGDSMANAVSSTIDLTLVVGNASGLVVGDVLVPWGGTVVIGADTASEKMLDRCRYRFRYVAGNEGGSWSIATTNRIFREAPGWPVLSSHGMPALPAGIATVLSGSIWLPEGVSTLYVYVDNAALNPAFDEADNLRRVSVIVRGDCN